MGPRRSKDASATCWWTRRVWCSKRGSTAQKWWIGTASSSCWGPLYPIASRACRTCGWTRDTPARRTGAPGGWRGRWVGPQRSCAILRSRPRGGDDEVGQGVGQGGRRVRPEEVPTPGGAQVVPAAALGGGEDLFLVGPEQEDEQGLREAAGDGRSPNLRGDEPPDGEEIGPPMRVFRQFQGELRRIYLPRTRVNKPSRHALGFAGWHHC